MEVVNCVGIQQSSSRDIDKSGLPPNLNRSAPMSLGQFYETIALLARVDISPSSPVTGSLI